MSRAENNSTVNLDFRSQLVLTSINQLKILLSSHSFSQGSIMRTCVNLDYAFHEIGYTCSQTKQFIFFPPYNSQEGTPSQPKMCLSTDDYVLRLIQTAKKSLFKQRQLTYWLNSTPAQQSKRANTSTPNQLSSIHKRTKMGNTGIFLYGLPKREIGEGTNEYAGKFEKSLRKVKDPITSAPRNNGAWR
jgi:hypothetical protein